MEIGFAKHELTKIAKRELGGLKKSRKLSSQKICVKKSNILLSRGSSLHSSEGLLGVVFYQQFSLVIPNH